LKKKIIIAAACLIAFILLIVLVRKVDVQTVEATGTEIGLFGLNAGFHKFTGVNEGWYKLTQILGIIALASGAVFAVIGVIQLIKRKSLLKVDRQILTLGGLYVVLGIVYLLFEIVKINFRPIIMEGETKAEASFPSSHTMLSIVVMLSVAIMLFYYVKNPRLRISLQAVCVLVALVAVIGRLICGVHWLTDIIGSVLISGFLISAFSAALDITGRKENAP
jgi:undecaprenyl-diphosphatase